MRLTWILVGVVVTLLGAGATLQGIGIVHATILPGDAGWLAIIGPVVAAFGLLIVLTAAHRRTR